MFVAKHWTHMKTPDWILGAGSKEPEPTCGAVYILPGNADNFELRKNTLAT